MYDFAVSFAGEQRPFAERLARELAKGASVFYDHFERHLLWGEHLMDELAKRYEASNTCVLLLSDEYLSKMWPVFERRVIVSNFVRQKGAKRVIPVRLDGFASTIPELVSVPHVSIYSDTGLAELTALLQEQLATSHA